VGYRRSKKEAHEAIRWLEFLNEQKRLFARAGLPGALTDRSLFDDFLADAFVPMPGGLADGTMFDIKELDAEQREALARLANLYVAEFGDPGVTPLVTHSNLPTSRDKKAGG
jgi:hypothetical protein